MYNLLQPLIFKLDAEQAHHLTLNMLKQAHRFNLLPKHHADGEATELMGMCLQNPVGLAAGQKRRIHRCAHSVSALSKSAPSRPQPGNPQPRLFRVPEYQAIINRMGFNNLGIDNLIANVRQSAYGGILGINIGKNADTPMEKAADDYLICLEKAYPHASYITVNISSPNTKNLRALQGGDELTALLTALKNKQAQLHGTHGRYVPLAVKIAPDLDEEQVADIAHVTRRTEMDGIIATNTTISKTALGSHPLAGEQGGLSGKPVREASNRVLRQLVDELNGKIPVIGVGGILDGQDAAEKLKLGASAIQVYSGLIYRGPGLVNECIRACAPVQG